MNVVREVLNRPELTERPPVLLDIGAAGEIDAKWRRIAPRSVCIAFDADDREMGYVTKVASGYRTLHVFNCIVTESGDGPADFVLTRSPQCSSLLEPRTESLRSWAFCDLFEPLKRVRLATRSLPSILDELGIEKVDWFKTDSQGTDLRLFKSLGEERIRRVLAAEFEPGIIDAYQGEDTFWQLLAFMEGKPFWVSGMTVKGSQRISRHIRDQYLSPLVQRFLPALLRSSPGWCEVTFLNRFDPDSPLDLRDHLLGWVFALIEEQYGFAVEIARRGKERFGDPYFDRLERHALRKIRNGAVKIPFHVLRMLLAKGRRIVGG